MLVLILTVAAVAAEDVSVSVGGTVELRGAGLGVLGAGLADVHWTWMMGETGVVRQNIALGSCRGRCALLEDGALRLKDARTSDSGVYRQEVFDEDGVCRSRKDITLTVYGPQVRSRGWTPLGLSLILFLLLIVIFIRRKSASSATNQSRDKDPQCLEENLYIPMFRANDPENQNQDQNQTRTQKNPGTKSESQTPSDPDPRCLEENLYVPIFRAEGPESQNQTQDQTQNSSKTKSKSQSPSDPGPRCLKENLYASVFRAKDWKSQNQTQDKTQDHTRTLNSPGTKSESPSDFGDPEEDIYV